MAPKLPIIISVPHGGEIIAPEMFDQTLLSRKDIFSDGDPLTRKIYDLKHHVEFYFETTIARATVDLNRSPDDLPPINQDGVIKSHTVTGKAVYHKNRIPSEKTLRSLLKRYYKPYHEGLATKSRKSYLFCGIDCHTMLNKAPVTSPNPGKQRPFICLSNNGDQLGNRVRGKRLTCSPEMIRSLAHFLKKQFPEERNHISLNDPFLGGHIVKRHSKKLPWIQLELNRRSYLSPEWYDPNNLEVCHKRITHLQNRLLAAIKNFVYYNHLPIDVGEKVV